MPAATYNFNIEKGTSFVIAFQYLDNNNIPINITNWCVRLRWRDDTNQIKTFYTNNVTDTYSFTTDPGIGKILFQIPAKETAAITWTSARYDMELQQPVDLYGLPSQLDNKKTFRILEGTISVIAPNIDTGYTPFQCDLANPESCRTCDS